nr:hypothetical protein [Tanacetum cinerariifolium]
MNGPYYRNHSRSVPVHKPKVVSIPVHFISSDHHQPQTNKHLSSALKIQKVFKGHTVRKALNKIVSIKNQVDEIEKRLQSDDVFVGTLRNDAKERLRVNETLMSLLFKLDSVRGVENGVRDVRKSVAKKAVALQEKVDSIVQTYEESDDDVSNDEDTEFDDVSNSIGNVVNEEDAKEEDVVDDDFSNDKKTALCDVSKENRDQELVVNEAMNGDSMKECDDDVSRNNVDSTNQTFEDYVDDVGNDNETELCEVSNSIPNKVNEEYVKDVVVDVDDVSNNAVNPEYVDNRDDVKEKRCDDDVSRSFVNEDRVIDYSNDDVNK